jgi:hypothetical protein
VTGDEFIEYRRHAAALIMAQLVHKSAAGSDFSSDLQLWDKPSALAAMAAECAMSLAIEVDAQEEL